ncbi:MAG: hypothetical protein Q8K63_11705 [Acidimicrobiales bacterium]|nr:hypothetical protein [Acidimicrobiales bacterium]
MRRAVHWIYEDRNTGRLVVGQWPNAPLWVFLAATVIRLVVEGTLADVAGVVRTLALLVWALLELFRGVNPFRRGLGAVVLLSLLARLV